MPWQSTWLAQSGWVATPGFIYQGKLYARDETCVFIYKYIVIYRYALQKLRVANKCVLASSHF